MMFTNQWRSEQDTIQVSHRAHRALGQWGIVLASAIAFSAIGSAVVSAQTTGLGYAFGAPGAAISSCGCRTNTLHLGGGGEVMVSDTVGIGGELGYLAPPGSMRDGLGMLSFNPSYHFRPTVRLPRLRPFVTGGYSLLFRDGHANLWNIGGGADYWFKKRVGLRAEFRDHVWSGDDTSHLVGARFGIVLR